MVSKKYFAFVSAFFVMFTVFSQETAESPVQEETEETNELKQPFSWSSAGDVLKYEIIIDRFDEKTNDFLPYYFHETTEEESEACLIYINPILPPGEYRSTIKVYNILGLLEEDFTSQDEFIVRRAYRPEVRSVSYPLYMRSTIYLDDLDNNGIIEVDGRNLFMPDETGKSLTFTDYALKNGRRSVKADKILSHSENNRKITFQFDMKTLPVGEYFLIATDASGLHSEENNSSKFTVKFKKWLDIDIEGGYTFPVILHDNTIKYYLETNKFPLSAQGKLSVMPFKYHWGYVGLGLRGTYSHASADFGTYSIDGNIIQAHALLIYQKPVLRRRVILELHGGPGVTYFNNFMFHFPNNIDSLALNTLSTSLIGGLAAQIYINKRLYTEVSADYIYTLNKDITMGTLQPSLGAGWQF
ncbi:hypothetical protein [Treponema sp.]|uniref:hypothetical protein n=1 Tax=Treponema sp. TaxID=166 RepID=UPI0038905882